MSFSAVSFVFLTRHASFLSDFLFPVSSAYANFSLRVHRPQERHATRDSVLRTPSRSRVQQVHCALVNRHT